MARKADNMVAVRFDPKNSSSAGGAKHLAGVEVTLFFPVIFHLTPNYPDLVKIENGLGNIHNHFSLGCTRAGEKDYSLY